MGEIRNEIVSNEIFNARMILGEVLTFLRSYDRWRFDSSTDLVDIMQRRIQELGVSTQESIYVSPGETIDTAVSMKNKVAANLALLAAFSAARALIESLPVEEPITVTLDDRSAELP